MSAEDMLDNESLTAVFDRDPLMGLWIAEHQASVKRDADTPCNRDEYDKADRYFDRQEFVDPDDNNPYLDYYGDYEQYGP